MRHSLELVNSPEEIRVASPCSVNWNDMAGDERARFCAQCRQQVYDLSTLTAAEALALLWDKEGNLCVRFYRRRDGRVKTADCLPPARFFGGPWRWLMAPVATLIALLLSFSGGGCYSQGKPCSPTATDKEVKQQPQQPGAGEKK